MTMQAQLKPETSGLGRDSGDVEELLDRAENALESSYAVVVDQWTLAILRNVRQNVSMAIQNQTSPLD